MRNYSIDDDEFPLLLGQFVIAIIVLGSAGYGSYKAWQWILVGVVKDVVKAECLKESSK